MFKFIKIIRDWQTLISTLVALVAAWWTVATIKSQLSAEKQRHEDALKRKEMVGRAKMPDALTLLARFTEDCMGYHDGRVQEPPRRPTDAIAALKHSIEFIDTGVAERVFDLVSFYQVHNARLFSARRRRAGVLLAERMYDTTLLRYYVDRLYDYARNETEDVKAEPSEEDLMSALRISIGLGQYFGNEEQYAGVLAPIERRA